MDISTGHMVLAYMEDHLKNKQRLDQCLIHSNGRRVISSKNNRSAKLEIGFDMK